MRDNERSRPGERTASTSDHLAGDTLDYTDIDAVGAAVEGAAIAVTMAVQEAAIAARLTSHLSPAAFTDAGRRAGWAGILAAIRDGQPPHPVAVGVAIGRHGITVPANWSGYLQTRLWELAADPPPVAMAQWLLEQVQEQATRRAVRTLGLEIADVSTRGEFGDVVARVTDLAESLLALLVTAVGEHA